MFAILKNTTFLLIVCASLLTSTVSLAIKTASLSAQVAGLTASAATTAVAHRKAIASAVARAKAKARLRRVVAAIPFAGLAAAAEFERRDYKEWQNANPEGTFGQYGCAVATSSGEVVEEVLQELPEYLRPSPDTVMGYLPQCDQ